MQQINRETLYGNRATKQERTACQSFIAPRRRDTIARCPRRTLDRNISIFFWLSWWNALLDILHHGILQHASHKSLFHVHPLCFVRRLCSVETRVNQTKHSNTASASKHFRNSKQHVGSHSEIWQNLYVHCLVSSLASAFKLT